MKDLFGKAILDYQTQNHPENINTSTNISDNDEMSVAYLFRDFNEMPKIEQVALKQSYGKILDIGCGAGSHSLYLQKNKLLDVYSIDFSENAIKACQLRGLQKVFQKNIFDIKPEDFGLFDTILLLMNGTGICGKLDNLDLFLQKLKSLLAIDGQILIDSSDIIYMYDINEKGAPIVEDAAKYYGELVFDISYKSEQEEPFDWLFLDFEKLQNACFKNGLDCQKIISGNNFDYLAKLSNKKKSQQ